jgi:hypothetical protein
VRRISGEIVVEFRRLLDLQETIEQAEQSGMHHQAESARQRLRHVFGRLEDCREELADVGVQLRDWLRGVVHFPTVIAGRPAVLCWRHGEKRVTMWHGPTENCLCRRPLTPEPGQYDTETHAIHHAVRGARRWP